MSDENTLSLEQRRAKLREELAAQRALVSLRLAPAHASAESLGSFDKFGDTVGAADTAAESTSLGVSAHYPRSMTMRLAKRSPALAVGLVALGVTLLLRGRREQLDDIVSVAKAVEPWFSAAAPLPDAD